MCKRRPLLVSRNHTNSLFHSLPCSFLIRPHLHLLYHILLQEFLWTVPNSHVSGYFTHLVFSSHEQQWHRNTSENLCCHLLSAPPPPQPPLLPALFYVSSRLFSLIGTLLSFVIWPCLCLGERFNGAKCGLIKRSHIRGSWSVLNQSQSGRRRDTDGKIDKMTQRETRARASREWKCSRKRR